MTVLKKITLTLWALGLFVCQLAGQTTNNLCLNSSPFCTDENPYGVSFPAGTGSTATPDLPSGQRGCLYYTPAPAWYVMQIDQPGDMLIYMSHSNNRDIDFACWGPFTGYATYGELLQAVCTSQLTGGAGTHRPTNGYHDPNNPSTWGGYPSGMMIDCSYSAASTEWCFIPNAQVGQWYIFLICNYSRASGTISFSIQSGDATTNCNILASVSNNGPLCEGEDLQLYCSANSSNGYLWTGPNGFTSTAQNPVIPNVTTANAGTYTVTYRPGNATDNSTSSTVVEIYGRPTASITAEPASATVCNGEQVILNGASNCDTCSYYWSNGATTHSISVMPSITTTYSLTVTNGHCQAVATQTINVGAVPFVAVTPAVITLCSAIGEVQLQAISSSCGDYCNYSWSTDPVNDITSAITISEADLPMTSPRTQTFTVTVTNSYGCTASASSTVSYMENADITDCNVFYADNFGDPASNGLTPSTPTTIQHAIDLAACTNAIIRLDTGTYNIDQPIELASNLTLEGGFFDDYKQKTSAPGATTIFRSDQYVEGTSLAPRIVAMEGSSLNNFRLQDLTIETANAPSLPGLSVASSNADDNDCYNIVEPGELLVNVGSGTSTENLTLPGNSAYSRSANLYLESELNFQTATTITAIGLYLANVTDVPADGQPRHLKVYMKQVSMSTFASTMVSWSSSYSGSQLVYDDEICIVPDQDGRVIIPVNFEFVPGNGNLLVLFDGVGCYQNGSSGGCPVSVYCGNPGGGMYGAARQGNNNTAPAMLARNVNRPNMAFFGCTSRAVTGDVVATVGNGATLGDFCLPGAYGHHRTAALYTSSEILTGQKMLSGIGFEVATQLPVPTGSRTRTLRVYMKNTTDATIPANQVWNQYLSNSSLVFAGTVCLDANGWCNIPINFAYEGDNLMVMVEGEGCTQSGGCDVEVYCTTMSNMCASFTSNDPIYYSINQLALKPMRPNIQLFSEVGDDGLFYVTESNYGVSTYALHLANCDAYDVTRCYFKPGNAGNGKNGVAGKNGGNGGAGGNGGFGLAGMSNGDATAGSWGGIVLGGTGGIAGTAGYSSGTVQPAQAGGSGGRGGQYDSDNRGVNAGQNGTAGGGNPSSGTTGHIVAQTAPLVTPGVVTAEGELRFDQLAQQGTGIAGTDGVDGAPGVSSSPTYNNYFIPAVQVNGGDGTGGTGEY
ncbi:MAG: hypothetical protein IJ986_05660 [Bacteroidales bacterium]|nr:hypothetical protein [Bacteroidales bacterium]